MAFQLQILKNLATRGPPLSAASRSGVKLAKALRIKSPVATARALGVAQKMKKNDGFTKIPI
jgi:hypothetical protein